MSDKVDFTKVFANRGVKFSVERLVITLETDRSHGTGQRVRLTFDPDGALERVMVQEPSTKTRPEDMPRASTPEVPSVKLGNQG